MLHLLFVCTRPSQTNNSVFRLCLLIGVMVIHFFLSRSPSFSIHFRACGMMLYDAKPSYFNPISDDMTYDKISFQVNN